MHNDLAAAPPPHVHQLHIEKHFTSSEIVRDAVIGMSDGLTVPFALAAGLSGAIDQLSIIITASFAEIAAGSIAMGLGGYLSAKSGVKPRRLVILSQNQRFTARSACEGFQPSFSYGCV